MIAPGNLHDVMMAEELLRAAGPLDRLLADKAYDTNRLRMLLEQCGIEAVIPSIARRKPMIPYNREAYRQRNLIERSDGMSLTTVDTDPKTGKEVVTSQIDLRRTSSP
jgi:transposase